MHGPARNLAACVAALLLVSTTGLADGASAPPDGLAALASAKRSAVLQLYAIESSLARARVQVAENTRREHALAQAHDRAVVRSTVLRRSLAATRERISTLLRRLYVEGPPDPIAVVLGAKSLSAMVDGIDALERATRDNRELASEARLRSAGLRRELTALARARAALEVAQERSEWLAAGLAQTAQDKRSTIAALQQRESLTRARLVAAEEQARAAARASRRLAPPASAVVSAPAAAPPEVESHASESSGASDDAARESSDVASTGDASPVEAPSEPGSTRTLVVDAVAYHLPGHTASGLPVGVGVIAVDPSVISLGTRVYVPGYGPAVAADVGSAIKGSIIDLWMPSTAAARSWGRRTVTITVYG
jgi:3D (Asp-Asp-Asp) domain-containing protein